MSEKRKNKLDNQLSEELIQSLTNIKKTTKNDVVLKSKFLENLELLNELPISSKELQEIISEDISETQSFIHQIEEEEKIKLEKEQAKKINDNRVGFGVSIGEMNKKFKTLLNLDEEPITEDHLIKKDENYRTEIYRLDFLNTFATFYYDYDKKEIYSVSVIAKKPEIVENSGEKGLEYFFNWNLVYLMSLEMIMKILGSKTTDVFDIPINDLLMIASAPNSTADEKVILDGIVHHLHSDEVEVIYESYPEGNSKFGY